MLELLKKFERMEHFELEYKCIYTLFNNSFFKEFKDKMISVYDNVSFYEYNDNKIQIGNEIYKLNKDSADDNFYEAWLLIKKHNVKLCFFNNINYRFIYPVLTLFYNDNLTNIDNVLYPNVSLITHIKDNRLINELKTKARIKQTPLKLIYKKDFINNSLVDTFIDMIIKDCKN